MAIDTSELVQAIGDAVIVSGADGAITLWNPAAERMFGFSAEEAMGQSLDIIIPERLRKRHWDGYDETMRTGVTRYGTQLLRVPAVHKDGRAMSIAFTVALLSGGDSHPHSIVAIVRDETQRWEQERALHKRIKDLEAGRKAEGTG